MRILIFTALASWLFVAGAQTITCPETNNISITEGWALTSQHQAIDWDGALKQDKAQLGRLLKMSLLRSEGLSGYVIECVYTNGSVTNVAPITGICDPQGLLQDCTKGSCQVECNQKS